MLNFISNQWIGGIWKKWFIEEVCSPSHMETMVFEFDSSSEIGAHVSSKIDNLICLDHHKSVFSSLEKT